MVGVSRERIITFMMGKARKELSGTKSGLNQGYQDTEIFLYTWIAFEAFTCLRYNLGEAGKRKDAFSKEFAQRYDYATLPDDCKRAIIGLKSYSIIDMTPGNKQRKPAEIKDVKNLQQVIDSIYRVRCNLFHGGKDINEITDIALIWAAGTTLYYLFEKFLMEEHYL